VTPLRSFLFTPVAALLFFAVNVFALHLLLRGHNAPGGGFIAGAGTALTLILLGLADGVEALQRFVRFDPMRIAAGGVALAFGTATVPLLFGEAVLQHHEFTFGDLPLVGEIAVSTTLVFDIGVYLLVVGTVTKLLTVLARSVARLGAFSPDEVRHYAANKEEPIEPARRFPRRNGKPVQR